MSNYTACAVSGNCTFLDGGQTNGTLYVGGYDPNAPVPYWHQRMELVTICVCDSLTYPDVASSCFQRRNAADPQNLVLIIIARVWYRWKTLHKFRWDDRWMALAALVLLPYWASQIGTNLFGSGLHMSNVNDGVYTYPDGTVTPNWLEWHWHFTPGWCGYYIITTLIKISVCFCLMEILPFHLKKLRYGVFALCGITVALGITMTFTWLFECTPVLSNFVWSIDSDSCINYDILRWLWVGMSIPIDFGILAIPMKILKSTTLHKHEMRILNLVFAANLLGTIKCILGIYGVWENRVAFAADAFYQETIFIMLNNVEILMYTIGASFPVFSRYLVARSSPSASHATHTWRLPTLPRFVNTFAKTFASRTTRVFSRATHSTHVTSAHSNLERPSFTNPKNARIFQEEGKEADYQLTDFSHSSTHRSVGSSNSPRTYTPRPHSISLSQDAHLTTDGKRPGDKNWGATMWIDTMASTSRESEERIIKEYS